MIEIRSVRFAGYDKNSHKISILLLTDQNESLEASILIGLPEVMTRETIEYVIGMNSAVSKNYSEDEEIDIQKIDRQKLDSFFEQVVSMIVAGRTKGALEVQISDEVG